MEILDFLIDRINYWTEERTNEFYGTVPPNKKYGETWHAVWEETEHGLLTISKRFDRTAIEVTLYGNDERFYTLNDTFGEHDWSIIREVYVLGTLYDNFRTEVPLDYQVVEINGKQWAYMVSKAPYGGIGTNPWDDFMGSTNVTEFMEKLINDTAVVAKSINSCAKNNNGGMSPHIFCGTIRWRNETGYYFRIPGNYTQDYNDSAAHGVAMMKLIHLPRLNFFSSFYNATPSDADQTNIVNLAKEKWIE